MNDEFVNVGLLTELSDHFPSSCTIKTLTGSRAATGQTVPSPTNLPNHVGLACRLSPLRAGEPAGLMVVAANMAYVTLAGYYPTVTAAMQADVDGVAYNVRGVEPDGMHVYTRLLVERVTT